MRWLRYGTPLATQDGFKTDIGDSIRNLYAEPGIISLRRTPWQRGRSAVMHHRCISPHGSSPPEEFEAEAMAPL